MTFQIYQICLSKGIIENSRDVDSFWSYADPDQPNLVNADPDPDPVPDPGQKSPNLSKSQK